MYHDNLDKHFIVIGKDGERLSQEGAKLNGNSSQLNEDIIESLLEEVKIDNKSVLIYIHGGLNQYKTTIERYKEKIPKILKDGQYPIFIIWRSGLIECYKDHLFRIRQGQIHYNYTWLTWIYFLIADIGRGIIRMPVTIYLQIINDFKPYMPKWNPDLKKSMAVYEILRKKMASSQSSTNKTDSIQVYWGRDLRTKWEKAKDIIKYSVNVIFKIVSSIFIDSFGTSSWGNMLRRTRTLFRTSYEFDARSALESKDAIIDILESSPTGALYRFLNLFSNKLKASSEEIKINLVGHSMGTIVLNQIVREFPNLSYSNLVYMAAACSITDFAQTLNSIKENSDLPNIYNLCLHPVAENVESNAFDLAPRGSLLVWIDNFMSSPTVIPDRRLGVWENIMQATQLIPKGLRRMTIIKCYDVGSNANRPQKHGDFSNENFWDHKFWNSKGLSIIHDDDIITFSS